MRNVALGPAPDPWVGTCFSSRSQVTPTQRKREKGSSRFYRTRQGFIPGLESQRKLSNRDSFPGPCAPPHTHSNMGFLALGFKSGLPSCCPLQTPSAFHFLSRTLAST